MRDLRQMRNRSKMLSCLMQCLWMHWTKKLEAWKLERSYKVVPQFLSVQLVYKSHFTMVYRWYIALVNGLINPFITGGAPPCMNTLMYDVNKKTTKKLWHKDVFQIFSGHLPNKNTESTCISLKAAPCTVHSLSWNKTWTHDLQVAVSHTIDIYGGHSWGWIFYLLPEELAHGKLVPIRRTFGFTFRYTFSYRQEQHGLLKKLCIRGCIGLLKNKIKGPKINSSNNMWLSSSLC